VLIVPEDPTLDQYVLKPVVERIFEDLGRSARVEVLVDPHIRGVAQALDAEMLAGILQDHPMIDLFVLAIDRDCDTFGNTAKAAARVASHAPRLLAVLAHQELEVWALALHRAELTAPWSAVREECHPKEALWDPFVTRKEWLTSVGRGRKHAMRALGANWSGLLQVCPEIATLRDDIRSWLARPT
jgi:hypothetical protein